MKTGGSLFLWALVIFIFFKRFAAGYNDEHDYHRVHSIPDA
jgi:putative membrane protein